MLNVPFPARGGGGGTGDLRKACEFPWVPVWLRLKGLENKSIRHLQRNKHVEKKRPTRTNTKAEKSRLGHLTAPSLILEESGSVVKSEGCWSDTLENQIFTLSSWIFHIWNVEALTKLQMLQKKKNWCWTHFSCSLPPFFFSCCVKLKENCLSWKNERYCWTLFLSLILEDVLHVLKCRPGWTLRPCQSGRVFFCMFADSHIVQFGAEAAPPSRPTQSKPRGPRRALRRQEPVQISLQAPDFFFMYCYAKKKTNKQRNCWNWQRNS